MEQARMFLAIALSFLVFFLWNMFFAEQEEIPKTPQQPSATQETQAPAKTAQPLQALETVAPEPTTTIPSIEKTAREPRLLVVKTPLYEVTLSEKQASVQGFTLANYRENNRKGSPQKSLVSPENQFGTFLVSFEGNPIAGLETALFTCDQDQEKLAVEGQTRQVRYSVVTRVV